MRAALLDYLSVDSVEDLESCRVMCATAFRGADRSLSSVDSDTATRVLSDLECDITSALEEVKVRALCRAID